MIPVPVDIRGARVSTVVVQRVPSDRVPRFLECQRALTQAAKGFPGYQSTELYPPADDRPEEWVAVLHFDDQQSCSAGSTRRYVPSGSRSSATKSATSSSRPCRPVSASGSPGWPRGRKASLRPHGKSR